MKDKIAMALSINAVWLGIWGWMELIGLLHSWLFA